MAPTLRKMHFSKKKIKIFFKLKIIYIIYSTSNFSKMDQIEQIKKPSKEETISNKNYIKNLHKKPHYRLITSEFPNQELPSQGKNSLKFSLIY